MQKNAYKEYYFGSLEEAEEFKKEVDALPGYTYQASLRPAPLDNKIVVVVYFLSPPYQFKDVNDIFDNARHTLSSN
jgi:hypothetical protein